jgi:hypothetical protein
MNPAVALAWNTTLGGVDDHWLLYVAAPFLGTALAVHLYKMVGRHPQRVGLLSGRQTDGCCREAQGPGRWYVQLCMHAC